MGASAKDLAAWRESLERADDELLDQAEKVVGRGCFNVKQDWKGRWSGHKHIPYLPFAIGYDVTRHGDDISGETGVDQRKRQGPLAGIIAWGDGANAPLPGPLEALATEEPKFERALADMMEKLLGK